MNNAPDTDIDDTAEGTSPLTETRMHDVRPLHLVFGLFFAAGFALWAVEEAGGFSGGDAGDAGIAAAVAVLGAGVAGLVWWIVSTVRRS